MWSKEGNLGFWIWKENGRWWKFMWKIRDRPYNSKGSCCGRDFFANMKAREGVWKENKKKISILKFEFAPSFENGIIPTRMIDTVVFATSLGAFV